MYIAIIHGWEEVIAFGSTEKEAQDLAIKEKRDLCPDEFIDDDEGVDSWNWDTMTEYFGARSEKVTSGLVITAYK